MVRDALRDLARSYPEQHVVQWLKAKKLQHPAQGYASTRPGPDMDFT